MNTNKEAMETIATNRFSTYNPTTMAEFLSDSNNKLTAVASDAFDINLRGGLGNGMDNQYPGLYLSNIPFSIHLEGMHLYEKYISASNVFIVQVYRYNSSIQHHIIMRLAELIGDHPVLKVINEILSNGSEYKSLTDLFEKGMSFYTFFCQKKLLHTNSNTFIIYKFVVKGIDGQYLAVYECERPKNEAVMEAFKLFMDLKSYPKIKKAMRYRIFGVNVCNDRVRYDRIKNWMCLNIPEIENKLTTVFYPLVQIMRQLLLQHDKHGEEIIVRKQKFKMNYHSDESFKKVMDKIIVFLLGKAAKYYLTVKINKDEKMKSIYGYQENIDEQKEEQDSELADELSSDEDEDKLSSDEDELSSDDDHGSNHNKKV